MIELVLVRHGQTDWNSQSKIQGLTDIPLNNTGIAEAQVLRDDMNDQFDYLISSPLKRAYKTTEILNNKLNLPIETDERLVERDFGDLTGCHVKLIHEADNIKDRNIEEGSLFEDRVVSFINNIAERGQGRYLVVTHGGFIVKLLSIIKKEDMTWVQNPIKNCSMTKLAYSGTWNIV